LLAALLQLIKPPLAHDSESGLCVGAVHLFVCLFVCLSVCRQNTITRFSGKLINLVSFNWAFQRTYYWIPKIQDGWDPPSLKSTWRHFFCRGWSDLDKISEIDAERHVDCGDVVEIETRCRIPIWRTFGRIQWHVSQSYVSHCRVLHALGEFTVTIPELHATLQGVRIPSTILKIVFRHILFLLFLMQFRLWRAAAFVSSPIHWLYRWCMYGCLDESSNCFQIATPPAPFPDSHETLHTCSMCQYTHEAVEEISEILLLKLLANF